jgi:hypothetical protein
MSRYEAEPAQESSRTVTVVLLSLLILTVIGALVGYVLGLRDIDDDKSAAGDVPSAVPPAVTSGTASRRPTPAPPGGPCPDFVSQAAKARDSKAAVPLRRVQYVRTSRGHEVWICQEADGSGLWYQGHDKVENWYEDGEVPQEGKNGLLRPGVVDKGNRTWVVTNDGTTYTVTPDGLAVTGGQNFTDTATQANPPR